MSRLLFEELLNKYLLESISRQENIQFFRMLEEPEYRELLTEQIGKDFLENTYSSTENSEGRERMKKALAALKPEDKKPAILLWLNWKRIAVAASVLLLFSTGAYFLWRNSSGSSIAETEIRQSEFKNDKAPGGNKAVLTLASGQQIILDTATDGTLAQQGKTKIIKMNSGQLAYKQLAGNSQPTLQYNTITTPRGGQYHLVLADGTNVWLNAASSLRYPVAFAGNERRVELTGEAYFEVVHSNSSPFRVVTSSETVEDIGTRFNVFAYADERAVKTTLLQGAVKVSTNTTSVLLKPGEQSLVNNGESEVNVVTADTDEAVAWKNGFFEFNRADIPTVMRSLGRWYDLDVVYQGNIPERTFTGEMHRNANISEALKILSLLKIDFRIEGKKIIVTNNNSKLK